MISSLDGPTYLAVGKMVWRRFLRVTNFFVLLDQATPARTLAIDRLRDLTGEGAFRIAKYPS